MPEHVTPVLAAACAIEIALALAGLAVWWLGALRPAARAQPPRLAPWSISLSDFFACALAVIGGGFLVQLLIQAVTNPFLRKASITEDSRLIVYSAAFQLGLLAGIFCAYFYLRSRPENVKAAPPPRAGSPVPAGLLTFVAVLAAAGPFGLVSLAWGQLIQLFGLPLKPQETLELFEHAHSRAALAGLFVFATVIAPMAEELVFRAGLFRYLRTRIPHWAALLLPALLFAALHWNWASLGPITALAIVFSLAYERTGRIGVVMIAHGLFNLNSILLVFAGMRS